MTAWLEQREKIQKHSILIKQRQQCHLMHTPTSIPIGPLQIGVYYVKMACNPTTKVTFGELAMKYGTIDFQDVLANFIVLTNYPGADMLIPFQSVPIFHRIKFTSSRNPEHSEIVDSIVVWPEQRDTCGCVVPSRFDTVLVHGRHQDTMHGTNGVY